MGLLKYDHKKQKKTLISDYIVPEILFQAGFCFFAAHKFFFYSNVSLSMFELETPVVEQLSIDVQLRVQHSIIM